MILPADMLPVPAIINCQPNKVEKDAMNISLYICAREVNLHFCILCLAMRKLGGGGNSFQYRPLPTGIAQELPTAECWGAEFNLLCTAETIE